MHGSHSSSMCAAQSTTTRSRLLAACLVPLALLCWAPPAEALAPAAKPQITGTAQVGQELSASGDTFTTEGAETGYAVTNRQWERCDAAGGNCSDIAGANGSTYLLTTSDLGRRLRHRVTAQGLILLVPSGNPVSNTSDLTVVVQGVGPQNTVPPSISGTAKAGQTLTADRGTWTGTATITYGYRWQRCAPPAFSPCSDIPGPAADDVAYTLTRADLDSRIRVRVTATGPTPSTPQSVTADSAPSPTAVPDPPLNAVPPTLSGAARDAGTLSSTPGSWNGPGDEGLITYSRQWLRCDAAGNGCAAIAGATGVTYRLVPADVGRRLRVRVIALGEFGDSAPAVSDPTAVVIAEPPASLGPPQIFGSAREGETFAASSGFWRGTPPLAFTYEWLRCDLSGGACTSPIATGQILRLTAADVGRRVRPRVTARNAGGTVSVIGPASPVIAAAGASTPRPAPPASSPRARRLSPFPVISIGGRLTARGVRLTQLTIARMPRGVRITVRCLGRACPLRRLSRRPKRARVRLRGFERALPAGVTIEIRVTKRGTIGKFTRIRIRRGRIPARSDACLQPGRRRPTSCPPGS